MPGDLEAKLADLGALWNETIAHVDVAEILGRDTVEVRDLGDLGDLDGDAPRRPVRSVWLFRAAAVLVAAALIALGAIVRTGDEPDRADVPPSTSPTPPEPATSGGMWPQSTLDEVRTAQERADAGDPAYTWQVDPQLREEVDPQGEHFDSWMSGAGQVELVGRFVREVLGWDAYMLQGEADEGMAGGGEYDVFTLRYLRCAPGRTNALYPPGPEPEKGELCSPTIDDLRYESVSVGLAQPDRQGNDGIWVVNGWRLTAPFEQADPVAVEARATERLESFLAARIAGTGAEGHVQVLSQNPPDVGVPLLYATTSGAPYERYEIERLGRPRWPDAALTFAVRLFADDDETVVEQEIRWRRSLELDPLTTTENGQPVVLSYTSHDGEVTISAPSSWQAWMPGQGARAGGRDQALDVWFGGLWRAGDFFGSGERIELVDPVAYDAWCAEHGGSPLLSAPANAAAIAQQLGDDSDFDTTAPVVARIGGVDAVSIDVALAPGGTACGVGMIEISRWIHGLYEPGWRLRLYLVDLPEGMSVQTLAITVVAPEERFDDVIAETAPIVESIEFHPRST